MGGQPIERLSLVGVRGLIADQSAHGRFPTKRFQTGLIILHGAVPIALRSLTAITNATITRAKNMVAAADHSSPLSKKRRLNVLINGATNQSTDGD
jgi:hypothetical protein